MRHVYRRPFDYSAPRRYFDQWLAVNSIEATQATAAFTTYASTVSGSGVTTTIAGPSGSRFTSLGLYRKRWNYAQINARLELIYIEDNVNINAAAGSAAFTTYAATVQLGSNAGVAVSAGVDDLAFTTYLSAVQGGREDPLSDNIGLFTTFEATIERTYGIGVSRIGPTQTRGTGTYSGGTVRGSRKRAVISGTNALAKQK